MATLTIATSASKVLVRSSWLKYYRNIQSGEEILQCKEFGEINSELKYDMFFENEEKQILVGNEMTKRLRERKKILEKNQ